MRVYYLEISRDLKTWKRHTDPEKAFTSREEAEGMKETLLFFGMVKDARIIEEAVN